MRKNDVMLLSPEEFRCLCLKTCAVRPVENAQGLSPDVLPRVFWLGLNRDFGLVMRNHQLS